MFAQFHESYITKDEVEMHKKRQHHKKASGFNHKKRDPHHNKEQQQQHKQQKEKIYEKLYFDYLPSEAETNQDNDELSHKINPKYIEQHQQQHKLNRRQRRDLSPENNAENVDETKTNKDVNKRQAQQLLTSHYFIENEKHGNYYNPQQPQGYYYPVPSNPLVFPPSRQYLPVNPAYTYQLIPSYSYQIFPQNHISYNPGTPPVNPRPYKPISIIPQKPNKRPDTQPGVSVDNRFDDGVSSFTDNDGRYIWGTKVDDTVYASR